MLFWQCKFQSLLSSSHFDWTIFVFSFYKAHVLCTMIYDLSFSLSYCTQYSQLLASYFHLSVCPSVRLQCCALWLNDTSYSKGDSEHVNRKCLSSNNFPPNIPTLNPQTHQAQNFKCSMKRNACVTWCTLCWHDAHAMMQITWYCLYVIFNRSKFPTWLYICQQ